MPLNNNYSLKKYERLCSKKIIEQLFVNGDETFYYPFRLVYSITKNIDNKYSPIRISISIPKKIHKKATKRNYLKRLIRESYRKNKFDFYKILELPVGYTLNIMLIYVSPKTHSYQEIEARIYKIFIKLVTSLKKGDNISFSSSD